MPVTVKPPAAPTLLTWNEAAPPRLPPLTTRQRLLGGLRAGLMLLATGLALIGFLAGRAIRRHMVPGFGGHYAVAKLWSRLMLHLLGIGHRVIGTPIRGAGVLVSNHASWADILALRAVLRINFVAKAEVRAWAGIGWVAEICETVFIERRRMASLDQAAAMRTRLRQGETLCIFAEGTSSDGLRVLPFKSALLSAVVDLGEEAGVAVQPVTINWIAPPGQPPAFFGWWGDMGFEAHIWQVACRGRGGRVEVVFHQPCVSTAFSDRKALTRHCETAVRSVALGRQSAPITA